MSKFEPEFLDDEKPVEPFEGCLVVFNVGQENYEKIGMTKDFERLLTDAVADAHASGWLVYYVFDSKRGSSPPPDFVDSAPEQDMVGLSNKVFGVDVVNLPLLPSERMLRLRRMVERISLQPGVRISGYSAVATGLCGIDGDEVFLPPTKIG